MATPAPRAQRKLTYAVRSSISLRVVLQSRHVVPTHAERDPVPRRFFELCSHYVYKIRQNTQNFFLVLQFLDRSSPTFSEGNLRPISPEKHDQPGR